jgi:hypothetical protein
MADQPLDADRITAASFAGTLAFGRLAIALLFACNAVGYHASPFGGAHAFGMLSAALAAGAAYWAQFLFTQEHVKVGLRFMGLSVLASGWAGVAFLVGLFV